MRSPHSPAFLAVRDRLLDGLADEDRARLASLLGPVMPAPKTPPPSADLLAFLNAFVELERGDQLRLISWVRKYVNRWGQVPQIYGHRLGSPHQYRSKVEDGD